MSTFARYSAILSPGGGGGGDVISVNGQVGVVTLNTDDIPQTANNAYVPLSSLNARQILGTDNNDPATAVIEVPGWSYDADTNGIRINSQANVNDEEENHQANVLNLNVTTAQASPNDSASLLSLYTNIDNSSVGGLGTNGQGLQGLGITVANESPVDSGTLVIQSNYFSVGNGSDPINVRGLTYHYGFGNVRQGVGITGPLQGYGFQPNIESGATIDPDSYTNAFYDSASINTSSSWHTSYNAGPTIASIKNDRNYTGMNINPNIGEMVGNASYTGLGVYSNIGTTGSTGGANGINIDLTVNGNTAQYVAGLNVNMGNATVFPGVAASTVIQDLTFTSTSVGDFWDVLSIEYIGGGTAGSEVVTNVGYAVTVQIEDGVSTANQIKAAMDADLQVSNYISTTVSGTGTNPQTITSTQNLAGGQNAGDKKAANFNGKVFISDNLQVQGTSELGRVNAFVSQAVLPTPGLQPNIGQNMVTSETVADNTTISGGDTLGLNATNLLQIGQNSALNTGFLGMAGIASPTVISMGSGSTLANATSVLSALSLDGSSTGGAIASYYNFRGLSLPNGVTSVGKLYGIAIEQPFGSVGTDAWGVYISLDGNNWFKGSIRIGGTAGSDDKVTNSSVGLEIGDNTKAFLNSRMTTSEKMSLTAVAGMMVYDTDLNQLSYYNGTTWINV